MQSATIYRPDGSTEPIDGEASGGDLSTRQCQRLVGYHGEWVRLQPHVVMLISTNAMERGLPVNLAATRLAGRLVHGDAVLVSMERTDHAAARRWHR